MFLVFPFCSLSSCSGLFLLTWNSHPPKAWGRCRSGVPSHSVRIAAIPVPPISAFRGMQRDAIFTQSGAATFSSASNFGVSLLRRSLAARPPPPPPAPRGMNNTVWRMIMLTSFSRMKTEGRKEGRKEGPVPEKAVLS